jgi:HD-GYP domain-containing protein (c-di-GMP phosphodiesterase class II)
MSGGTEAVINGISYDDIPLVARITSVCDAYDAMTSDRRYRMAHTHYYACRELEKNAGPNLIRRLYGYSLITRMRYQFLPIK